MVFAVPVNYKVKNRQRDVSVLEHEGDSWGPWKGPPKAWKRHEKNWISDDESKPPRPKTLLKDIIITLQIDP